MRVVATYANNLYREIISCTTINISHWNIERKTHIIVEVNFLKVKLNIFGFKFIYVLSFVNIPTIKLCETYQLKGYLEFEDHSSYSTFITEN